MVTSPAPIDRRVTFWHAAWSSYTPEILILLAYVAVRLVALTDTLPVFIDEATMIIRARDMLNGYTFEPMKFGKWLQVALVALLRPKGPETLWAARGLTALLATLSCAGAMALGRLLDSRLTGRLAGALTVLAPLAVFSERQAMADPVLAAFLNLSLVLVVMLARTGRWRYALASSVALVLGAISKLTGLFFLALPVVGAVLLARRRRVRVAMRGGLAAALALALIVGFILYADSQVSPDRRLLTGGRGPSSLWCRHAGLCEGDAQPATTQWKTSTKLDLYQGIMEYYVGLPTLALAALAGVVFLTDRRARGAVVFLLVPGVGLGLLVVLVSNWYPVRYLNFTVSSLAVLAAITLSRLWRLGERLAGDAPLRRASAVAAIGVIVAVTLAGQASVDVPWLRAPYAVKLPPPDGQGCDGFGYGYDHVGETMRNWLEANGGRANVVTKDPVLMQAYWGTRVGAVKKWRNKDELRAEVASWVANGHAVFFADVSPSKEIPEAPFGATLETVETFPLPCGEDVMRVRQLVQFDGE